MNQITVRDIAEAVQGTVLAGKPDMQIDFLMIDSRERVSSGDGRQPDRDGAAGNGLFIPIIGEKTDAHRYIDQAFENGAAATLTSEHTSVPAQSAQRFPEKCWIAVRDTIEALHAIGHLCRSRISLPAVGVTGSVGKTTTREMISHAMASQRRIFKTSKNYNSQIGVPITMSMMSNDYDYAVLELGMNVPGELGMISEMARLDIAVITNIGVAHIEHFGTQDSIALEKLSICRGLREDGLLFLNGDDPYLVRYADTVSRRVLFYGTKETLDYYATDIVSGEDGSRFLLHIKEAPETIIPVELGVPGRHNVLNALAALAVCHQTGLSVLASAQSLQSFGGFMNRLEITKTGSGITVIDDTYNASPASMRAGLDVLCGRSCTGRRIAVLGDMFELGKESPRYHYEVGVYAAATQTDILICIGTDAAQLARAVRERNTQMQVLQMTQEEAYAYLGRTLQAGDIVYLKASNGMKFKALAARLKEL